MLLVPRDKTRVSPEGAGSSVRVHVRPTCQPGGPFACAIADAQGVEIGRAECTGLATFSGLRPGKYELNATRTGWEEAMSEFECAAGASKEVELAIRPFTEVTGQVVDGSTGKPVPGVELTVESAYDQNGVTVTVVSNGMTLSGAGDTYALAVEVPLATRVRVRARAPGHESCCTDEYPIVRHVVLLPTLVLEVREEGEVRGTAVDEAGVPLEGAEAVLVDDSVSFVCVRNPTGCSLERRSSAAGAAATSAGEDWGLGLPSARTDAHGRFAVAGALPSRTKIVITRPGFEPWISAPIQLDEANRSVELLARLERGCTLVVNILSSASSRSPYDPELLSLSGRNLVENYSLPRADGAGVQRIELNGLPQGAYDLVVSARPGGREHDDRGTLPIAWKRVQVSGRANEVSVLVGDKGGMPCVSGGLALPAGIVSANVLVSVCDRSGPDSHVRSGWPDAAGNWSLCDLETGTYDLLAVGSGDRGVSLWLATRRNFVIGGSSMDVGRLTAEGATTRISVERSDGRKTPGLLVSLRYRGQDPRFQELLEGQLAVRLDEAGQLILTGLPAGVYEVDSLDGAVHGLLELPVTDADHVLKLM